MPRKRSKKVRVTVSGEVIMNCARKVFLTGDVTSASTILNNSLPFITQQDLQDVLDGKKKLAGDSSIGVSIVEDDDDAYRSKAQRVRAEAAKSSSEDEYDEDWEDWAEEQRIRAEHQRIADEVKRQAAGDVFSLKVGEETFSVPRAPFWNWALRRCTNLIHLAPKWTPVSRAGLKIFADDPYHNDWMLGAGIDLSRAYDPDVNTASWDAAFELQGSLASFEAAVVVEGYSPLITGVVGEGIRVVPHLGVEYAQEMTSAQAIITERGGAMAHMAVLALERGLCILRVPNATTRYLPGMKLALFPAEGHIQLVSMGTVV